MVKVSQTYMERFAVPFLGNIEKQREIIGIVNATLDAASAVRKLQSDARNQISKLAETIWG